MKKLLIAAIISSVSITANAESKVETAAEAAPEAVKITPAYPPKITFEEAKKIAVDAVRDTIKVTEAELEMEEGGTFTYEIEVEAGGVETEVEIDATNGNILEVGADD